MRKGQLATKMRSRLRWAGFFLGLCLVGAIGWAQARSASNLEISLNQQVTTLNEALASSLAQNLGPESEQEFLQNFWLRVRLPVGFIVPGFASVQIVPEVEMLFRKDVPDGWGPYHP